DDRHECRAHVPEKDKTDEGDDDAFLDQLLPRLRDRAVDQIASIIGRHDSHTGRQRRLDAVDLAFDAIDYVERVFTVAHHHNSTDDFAFTVKIGDFASQGATEMNLTDIFDVNGRAGLDFEDDILDVGDAFEITATTYEIFCGCDLKRLSAHVAIARFHTRDDLAQWNVVCEQRVGIEIDLVFLYETPNRGDFRDAFHGFERVTQIPVLNRAQLRQVELPGIVN